MGLSIHVYTNIKPAPEDDEDAIRLYNDKTFTSRGADVPEGSYTGSEAMSFRAGSYSGYNQWRRDLCQAIYGMSDKDFWYNPQLADSNKPFAELINFTDCDGYIGTLLCKKLADDFQSHEDELKDLHLVSDWFTAFRIAGDTHGVVEFS